MNQQLFESIEAIVREAGRIVKNAHAGSEQIEKKEGLANFVTAYDVQIQQYLIGEFQKLIPDAAAVRRPWISAAQRQTGTWAFSSSNYSPTIMRPLH